MKEMMDRLEIFLRIPKNAPAVQNRGFSAPYSNCFLMGVDMYMARNAFPMLLSL